MTFFYLTNFYDQSLPHVIHALGCPDMPDMNELSYLGPYNNCSEALRSAGKKVTNATVCACCCEKLKASILNNNSC
ncbi:hypothetical protein DN752_17115 [Echinicola strongylocentroti]|uniref:Uncharacterized protein n=1 Tax=Echinicola strongylocentroti TaxID=1795355 RepID=A0A2Z4IKS2_9BACT|nr:hypothetical protein DN752_17115 [Echinicola strongylocentroti]